MEHLYDHQVKIDVDDDIKCNIKPEKRPYRKRAPKQLRRCDICGEFYLNLSRHRLIHQNIGEFVCTLCNKSFVRADLCEKHRKRVHCPIKLKIICPLCNMAFVNLRKHQRRAHQQDKPYRCDQCDRAFIWPSYLKSHQQRSHRHEIKMEKLVNNDYNDGRFNETLTEFVFADEESKREYKIEKPNAMDVTDMLSMLVDDILN